MDALADIVLASASPRRQELLKHIVDDFRVIPANIDEAPLANENGPALVTRLAKSKAQCVAKIAKNSLVIGSDTVVCKNDTVLGKPKDYQDFLNMMTLLSNSSHQVHTGLCVMLNNTIEFVLVSTNVQMGLIIENDAKAYWLTNEPKDKAGGYAIQGIGGQFVKRIDGSYSAVVGLPLYETKNLISKFLKLHHVNQHR